MIKVFNVGDRVVNLVDDGSLIAGDIGTVIDEDVIPYILWDRLDEVLAQYTFQLELLN